MAAIGKARFPLFPVILGVTFLLGLLGMRIIRERSNSSSGQSSRPHGQVPTGNDHASVPSAGDQLMDRLRQAFEARDVTNIESVCLELASRGVGKYGDTIRVLLVIDNANDTELCQAAVKPHQISEFASSLLNEINRLGWLLMKREDRQKKLAAALALLKACKNLESNLNLDLLLKHFDDSKTLNGRVALAILSTRLGIEGWLRLVRAVLPQVQDPTIRAELLGAITDTYRAHSIRFLLALYFDSDVSHDCKKAVANAIGSVLPPDEALSVLLSAVKSEASIADELAVSDVVCNVVENVPFGLQMIRNSWKDLQGVSPKCAILVGLGGLEARQDVSAFLLEQAQANEDVQVRGTALLSASRQLVNVHLTYAIASKNVNFTSDDEAEKYSVRSNALSALRNIFQGKNYTQEVKLILSSTLSNETDPRVVVPAIKAAMACRILEVRDVVQKYYLETSNPNIKAASANYLEMLK